MSERPIRERQMNEALAPPLAILAELTHRCPLQCAYCSNPLELAAARDELSTAVWQRVIDEAAALGALQIHFSGGEPAARRDLEQLVRHAAAAGLYSNLITSGVSLNRQRLAGLVEAGLDHIQLSFQDSEAETAERIGNYRGAQARKLEFAGWVRESGLPLTVNAVVHRQNLDHLEDLLELALTLGAGRIEIAHVQYYGWALLNRRELMPTRAQLETANRIVAEARQRLAGRLVIDYVPPDYYAQRPKACMGGWGRMFMNISPTGKVLPCHAAETITGLAVRQRHRALPGRYLGILRGLSALSRNGLDARALPELRAARDRLGRLPLPGSRPHRPRRQHRPGLRAVARAFAHHPARARRRRG